VSIQVNVLTDDIEDREFTAGQAARVVGVPRSTVDYWERSGFLARPSGRGASETKQRSYTFRDLVALRVARRLREAGISLQALRKVMHVLCNRKGTSAPLADTHLATDGIDVYEKQDNAMLRSLLRNPGQGCFFAVIDLSNVADEVKQAVTLLTA
jgi:DNA-binding transcriptional MerR regulator